MDVVAAELDPHRQRERLFQHDLIIIVEKMRIPYRFSDGEYALTSEQAHDLLVGAIHDFYERHKKTVEKVEYIRLAKMIDVKIGHIAHAEDGRREEVAQRRIDEGGPTVQDVDVVMHNIKTDVDAFLEDVQEDRSHAAREVARLRTEVAALQERLRKESAGPIGITVAPVLRRMPRPPGAHGARLHLIRGESSHDTEDIVETGNPCRSEISLSTLTDQQPVGYAGFFGGRPLVSRESQALRGTLPASDPSWSSLDWLEELSGPESSRPDSQKLGGHGRAHLWSLSSSDAGLGSECESLSRNGSDESSCDSPASPEPAPRRPGGVLADHTLDSSAGAPRVQASGLEAGVGLSLAGPSYNQLRPEDLVPGVDPHEFTTFRDAQSNLRRVLARNK